MLAVASAAVAIFSVASYGIAREAGHYLFSSLNEAQQLARVTTRTAGLPLWEHAQSRLLQDCFDMVRSFTVRAQPTERRLAVVAACRDYALDIADAAPAHGQAWAFAALFAGQLADATAFNRALQQSARVAPYEQWLVRLRVAVTEDHLALSDATTLALETTDLAVLVDSRKGVTAIARRYVDEPEFRERVVAVVETLDAAAQQRVLADVKSALPGSPS